MKRLGKEHNERRILSSNKKLKVDMIQYKSASPKSGNIIVQQTATAFDHDFSVSGLFNSVLLN